MNHLHEILKINAEELNIAFNKAKLEGSGTPQEVSDRREVALADLLKRYFPYPFRITKGNIRDSYGNSSQSIDCIVINPIHPYTTIADGPYSIILADGVDVAIELKPELNSDVEIIRALKQVSSIKKLKRVKSSKTAFIGSTTKGDLERFKRIPAVIFSDSTYININTLLLKIVEFYEQNSTPRIHQFDLIIVNRRCVIINSSVANYNSSLTDGFTVIKSNEDTLSLFLFLISSYPTSNTDFNQNKNILFNYLKPKEYSPEEYDVFIDINARLQKLPYFDEEGFDPNDIIGLGSI